MRRKPSARISALEWLPTPAECKRTPELTVLAILAGILEVVSTVMLAANPALLEGDDDRRPSCWPLPPTTGVADSILRQVARLRRTVDDYRRIALPEPPPELPPDDDDMPF